jgi:demethylmenaquinone methyltransferase/2-methoxy-6-polyprenyl-1,4-benzoquinol methylase
MNRPPTILGPDGALPEGSAKATAVEAMFDRIAPSYERTNQLISLGQDRRWRRRAVESLGLRRDSTVLDLACGTGDLCRDLAAADLIPLGVDISAGMLGAAHTDAPLVRADILDLPVPDGSVDGIVCGFALRNVVSPAVFFHECARVLRVGGRLVILDATVPDRTLMRAGHALWFGRVVPIIGRRLSADPEAYAYLAKSTAYLPPPADLLGLCEDAGFTGVRRTTFTGGSVFLLSATRAGDNP